MRKVLASLFFVACMPAVAWAQAGEAQAHFEKGAEWYTAGEYSKAIVEFLKGYNLEPNAMFLYNVSLSYTKLGNYDEAMTYAERARAEQGMPDDVAVRNDARIAALSVQRSTTLAASRATQVSVVEPEPVEPAPEAGGFGVLGISGVVVGVAGLGLVGGAYVINSGVSEDIEALEGEANGGDRQRFDQLKSDIEGDQTLGQILLFSGLGLAAAGVTMVALELTDDEQPSTATLDVVPSVSGAQAVFTVRY